MASDVYELIRSSYSGPFGNRPLSKFLMLRGERMKGGAFPRNISKGVLCGEPGHCTVLQLRDSTSVRGE